MKMAEEMRTSSQRLENALAIGYISKNKKKCYKDAHARQNRMKHYTTLQSTQNGGISGMSEILMWAYVYIGLTSMRINGIGQKICTFC